VGNKVWLKLVKGVKVGYYLLENQIKLSFKKIGPYIVIRVISLLLYEIALPEWLKIYPVIIIEYLEKKDNNPYQRRLPGPRPI